jgi:hypothetical protein
MEDVVRAEIRRAAVARRTTVSWRDPVSLSTITPAEKGLIWSTMREPAAAQPVLAELETDDLSNLTTGAILRVASTLVDWPAEGVPSTLLERLTQDEAALVSGIAAERAAPAAVTDCGIELRRLRFERERAALQDEIDQRQQLGTPGALEEIDDLWQRKKDLLQRIEALGGQR